MFDVLVLLMRELDRVVTKEEILDTVWGDRFVSESALTSRIKALRQALGDDGKAQRLVRTHDLAEARIPAHPLRRAGLRADRLGCAGLLARGEALAESGDRDYCHAAELHRLRALLIAERGADDQDVTAELVQARDIARRQGAPLLEDRASHALDEVAPAVA